MHWLNIEIIRTQGPEYTSAEPAQQLAWFHLLLYCAQQENGGIIREAATFTDRQWMRLIDVEGATLRTQCSLWTWREDGSLIVWEYPAKQEQVVQAKREGGRRGGDAKAQNRSTASGTPSRTPTSTPTSTPSGTPSTKEELEEKEKEKEESFASAAADAGNTDSLSPIQPIQPIPPKPKREPKLKPETPADPRKTHIMAKLKAVYLDAMGADLAMEPSGYARTQKELDKLLPLIPNADKDEILNQWHAALCAARHDKYASAKVHESALPFLYFSPSRFSVINSLVTSSIARSNP